MTHLLPANYRRSLAAQSAWASLPLEAAQARIRAMHVGRDAARKKARSIAEATATPRTLAEWRKSKAKLVHASVFRFRRIARVLALLCAANPLPEGLEPITIEELDDLFASGRCRVLDSGLLPWKDLNGAAWWTPVPLCLDPALGFSSGNVVASSNRGFRLASGAPALEMERAAFERFLSAYPSAVVSTSRILPNLKASCPLDALPPAILADLEHMERTEREAAEQELNQLFK